MSKFRMRVQLSGLLGEVVEASAKGRLSSFVCGTSSEPIALFTAEKRSASVAGDWYGEHAGKWMIAASRAALRTGNEELAAQVTEVALFLASCQEPDGYLGTYAPFGPRFTNPTSEGARTWDVWVHAYAMLGLIEAHRLAPEPALLEVCHRVYRQLDSVFRVQKRPIVSYGNHQGLSSLIVINPLAQLTLETGDAEPARLALHLLESAAELDPVGRLLRGDDIATIGTGKIYQLAWLLEGLAVLAQATGRSELLTAAKRGWESICRDHLTPAGGPWGGIGRHKEVFNDAGYFSPSGMVETCSAMAWIGLSRALHALEPDPRYAEEIERTLYNTILGAADPNGEDWAYFTFPNGLRNPTYFWACCKSSGAMALEGGALSFYSEIDGCLAIDLFGAGRGEVDLNDGRRILVEQETVYPADGDILIRLSSERSLGEVRIRIPSWCRSPRVDVNGESGPVAVAGEYLQLNLGEMRTATVRATFPMVPRILKAAHTIDHHGQEIVRDDYFAVMRGPLAYATGLHDGYKKSETLRAPHLNLETRFDTGSYEAGDLGPALHLNLPGHAPVEYRPYVDAGGRTPGSWRAIWQAVAWQ